MFTTIPDDQQIDMLKQAVYQQLFLGEDRIMGRMPINTMAFKDVGRLLNKFIREVKKQLEILDTDHLEDFLVYFEKMFEFNLSDVKERIENNFVGMGDLVGQEVMVLYMCLTKLLESTREEAYKKFGLIQIKEAYKKQMQITGEQADFNGKLKKKIQNLAATGDENMSLLYNLCFIRLLADSFKQKPIAINAKKQITKKVNLIVKNIS